MNTDMEAHEGHDAVGKRRLSRFPFESVSIRVHPWLNRRFQVHTGLWVRAPQAVEFLGEVA